MKTDYKQAANLSKDQTYHFFKKSEKSYVFFKTRFKIFLGWFSDIDQVCGRLVFHNLNLPPFQINVGVVPGVVKSRSSQ